MGIKVCHHGPVMSNPKFGAIWTIPRDFHKFGLFSWFCGNPEVARGQRTKVTKHKSCAREFPNTTQNLVPFGPKTAELWPRNIFSESYGIFLDIKKSLNANLKASRPKCALQFLSGGARKEFLDGIVRAVCHIFMRSQENCAHDFFLFFFLIFKSVFLVFLS